MPLRIRPMTRQDKSEVMAFLSVIPQFTHAEVVVAEEVIDAYLKDPSGSGYLIFVAEADSKIFGYVCYGPTPMTLGTWDMYWIAVDPRQQGKGIGQQLMKSAEQDITRNHARMVLVETSSLPHYENTRKFYLGQGYEIICRIADFYAPGDDQLIFQKKFS